MVWSNMKIREAPVLESVSVLNAQERDILSGTVQLTHLSAIAQSLCSTCP